MNSTKQIILHIDFDSFFASAEQQYNPFFRGKPLGVTATNGRNCIIASSREAKKLGIKTGSRVFDARKVCPELLLTGADFRKYWEISKKFIALCQSFSPTVEVFSIDELFLDATKTAHLFGGVSPMIKTLKTRIRKEIGEYITVSVGISHNKLLAKLASGLKKPNGEVFIAPHQVEQVYKVAQLTDICGIGPRIEQRLHNMGIYTLSQLRRAPLSSLVAEFGNVEGNFLQDVGQGVDTSIVNSYHQEEQVKSVSRNYCLPQNEYDKRIVLQEVYELCEEVSLKLRRLELKARSGGLMLRGENTVHGHRTYRHYFDTGQELFEVCQAIINGQFEAFNRSYIRQISIWASLLTPSSILPESIFPAERRRRHLINVMDNINDKFGTHTIRNGFLLYAPKLTTMPNGYMADRYERMKLARSAEG